MTTHPIPLTDMVSVIAVPEGAYDFEIRRIGRHINVYYKHGNAFGSRTFMHDQDYRIINSHDKLTEEQWAGIVDCISSGQWRNYMGLACLRTATESGLSLMTARGAYVVNPLAEWQKAQQNVSAKWLVIEIISTPA